MVTREGPTAAPARGKIHVLPADVVSRIAAGEVVERPAAVVKELIENSLDAGGRTITVDVRNGGLRSIAVTDDGEGMGRADALLAFERHATSKLRSDDDLRTIRTMGFRGEALPSIASVSRVTLASACAADRIGTELSLVGGVLETTKDVAVPVGTRIVVNDLFFNTPARHKFLKTPATEFSHVSHAVQQAALAWPEVHVRLTHNGQEVLDLPAVPTRRERIRQVYQRRFVEQCREVRLSREGLALEGLVVDPVHCRAGRSPQDLFLNRRAIKSPTTTHAVYEAYSSFLGKGRHPLFVLFLDLDPELIDVNVHPTKREVRFLSHDLIHREVMRVVRESLGPPTWEPYRQSESGPGLHASPLGTAAAGIPAGTGAGPATGPGDGGGGDGTRREAQPRDRDRPHEAVQEPAQLYGAGEAWEIVPLGQVRQTFLVVQVGGELQVVDQHTAHERVLFERLRRAWGTRTIGTQPLLIPEPFELPVAEAERLRQHLEELAMLGIVIDDFGSTSFLVREVPAVVGRSDYVALVQDLLDDLGQRRAATGLDARVHPMLATVACHSAVRAGRPMEAPEIKQLIGDWASEGFPMTCPHGRRVALRLSMEELEKIFARA